MATAPWWWAIIMWAKSWSMLPMGLLAFICCIILAIAPVSEPDAVPDASTPFMPAMPSILAESPVAGGAVVPAEVVVSVVVLLSPQALNRAVARVMERMRVLFMRMGLGIRD